MNKAILEQYINQTISIKLDNDTNIYTGKLLSVSESTITLEFCAVSMIIDFSKISIIYPGGIAINAPMQPQAIQVPIPYQPYPNPTYPWPYPDMWYVMGQSATDTLTINPDLTGFDII